MFRKDAGNHSESGVLNDAFIFLICRLNVQCNKALKLNEKHRDTERLSDRHLMALFDKLVVILDSTLHHVMLFVYIYTILRITDATQHM